MITPELLTADEAAQYLRVERRTLQAWTLRGKVPAYRLSGSQRIRWRYRKSELDAMLQPSPAVLKKGQR